MTDMQTPTFADLLRQEEEQARRRFIHHTRPQRPLSLDEAIRLSKSVAVEKETT